MPISIPSDDKRFSQLNNSDLLGNVYYTKNINFDEEGYIKLSPRSVQLTSEKIDPDFGIPVAFGRSIGVDFFTATTDKSIDITVSNTELDAVQDTGTNNPGGSGDSWGEFFNNRWHVSTATGIFYKTTAGGNWTDTGISLTSGKSHVLETFTNKVALAVANGNTVRLYDTSYALQVTLTISSDYEVVGLSYSNNQMGISTQLSDTGIIGKNEEALFFIWDGGSTSAGAGIPVGSDMIVSLKAYMGSWVILTRTGELKFWNGGSFGAMPNGQRPALPFYFKDIVWGDSRNREAFGDIMQVDGENLLINVNASFTAFGKNAEQILPSQPGGVWCYDPKVGLHHKYSGSVSQAAILTVQTGGTNTTTDTLTASAGTVPATGNPIKYVYNSVDLIGGLTIGTVYYVIRQTSTTFSLAESKQDAVDGIKINLTSAAAGESAFLAVDIVDFAPRHIERTGGIALIGENLYTGDHIIFGGEYYDYASSANYNTICITVSGFENRGYVVYPRIFSQQVEDNAQSIYVFFSMLEGDDRIILKVKDRQIRGLPVSTPQASLMCTWTATDSFTTTANLSDVKTFLDADSVNECEVEVLSGAGAGTMAQIESISYLAGTYTVTLAEEVPGAAASRVCNVLIDNWRVVRTSKDEGMLTPDSLENVQGWAQFTLDSDSKSHTYKLELRGADTRIEGVKMVGKNQIPAL